MILQGEFNLAKAGDVEHSKVESYSPSKCNLEIETWVPPCLFLPSLAMSSISNVFSIFLLQSYIESVLLFQTPR
jgi:hypothetical protein